MQYEFGMQTPCITLLRNIERYFKFYVKNNLYIIFLFAYKHIEDLYSRVHLESSTY